VQQAKGKVQKAWGNIKDAARDANKEAEREREADRAEEADGNRAEHHHGA
jgi:hypothetical protein